MLARGIGACAGKVILALLVLCAAAASIAAPAGAEIVLEEGADKATAPHLEWDFGDAGGNVELVQSVKWRREASEAFGSNLVANSGIGGCGDPFEFWGEAYPNRDGYGPAPVVAGNRGTWDAASNRTVLIDSSSPHSCSGNTPEIPIRTRYTYFDEGPAADVVRMERRIFFAANQEPQPSALEVQGMRFYVPRLPVGTYNQEIFPNEAGTALNTRGVGGITVESDWNESWLAINSSGANAGVLIFHKPDGSHAASVTIDNDGASGSNNSGITLDRPALGWIEPVTETEYLCFYDATTWPVGERSPTKLPEHCATPVVPVNLAAPKISAGAGNPRAGEGFTAEPGSWENGSGFTYRWYRCLGESCTVIGGATGTSYTATTADVGHSLKVRVTATAPGGETDFAESNVAGTVSGHVYEGAKEPAHLLGGARVQICRLKGAPCRSTTADSSGFYTLQAPSLGKYRVTAFPPAGSNAIARTRTTVTVVKAETETENQDVVLPLPQPPPPSVHFAGPGTRAANAEGVPVVYWQEPFEINYETALENEVEAKIEFPDGLSERVLPQQPVEPSPVDPNIGIFKFLFKPLYPNHGAGRVSIVVRPPRSQAEIEEQEKEAEEQEAEEEEQEEEEENEPEEPEEEPETPEEEGEHEKEHQEEEAEEREAEEAEEEGESEKEGNEETVFPIYIDPSGLVRTVDGSPIAGASVTLFEAASAGGPFTPVADGSAVMSPLNRKNPDATDAGGHFGWDVVAGFYKVRAEKGGCGAPGGAASFVETGVMTIPPPVANLDLRLDCAAAGPVPQPPTARPPPVRLRASLKLPHRATVKVDRKGRFKVKSATVTCPGGATSACRASIRIKAALGGSGKRKLTAKKLKSLGAGGFSVPAGKTASLSGKLSGTALKQLLGAKRLAAALSIIVVVPGGEATKGGPLPVTFLAPPKKHGR